MRYNKKETRKALIYECSRSTSNREIKKYALEFVEDLNDGEYFKNPTRSYAQTGCGEEIDIFYQYKGKECLTRLFLDRLTPAKLFYYINYTMS